MTPAPEPIRLQSVLLWGLINLALLGLGTSGFPLWAHHPAPKESICFFELICGQVIVAGLLFPYLAPTIWTLVINLVLLVPVGELAGFMSNLSQMQILRGTSCVALWISGLAGLGWFVSPRRHLIFIACMSLFVLGGAILDYLRWESVANNGGSGVFITISFLPKLVQNTQNGEAWGWVEAGIPLLLALVFAMVRFDTPQSTTNSPAA